MRRPASEQREFIDPHHHPEAAKELQRRQDGTSKFPSVNAELLDPAPRERKDEEDKRHAKEGGDVPANLRGNEPTSLKDPEDKKQAKIDDNTRQLKEIADRVKQGGVNRAPDDDGK